MCLDVFLCIWMSNYITVCQKNFLSLVILPVSFIHTLGSKFWNQSSQRRTHLLSNSAWVNGSLDLYPTSRCLGMRSYYILYLILNQYYQKSFLITGIITSNCSIKLHRPLWEHLVNRGADQGTHLFKDSSTSLRTIVNITWTISCFARCVSLDSLIRCSNVFGFMSYMCMRQCG
jgi:hypothetical protein